MYIHRFLLLPLMSLLCSFLELMGCFQLFVVFLLGASDHEDGFTVLLVEFKPNLQFSLFGGWQSISFFGALWWSNESKNQTQSPSQTDTSSSATRPISQIDISTKMPQVSPFACCGAMVIFAQYLQEAERNLRNNHWPKDLSWIAILFARDPCGKQKGQHQAQLAVSQNWLRKLSVNRQSSKHH